MINIAAGQTLKRCLLRESYRNAPLSRHDPAPAGQPDRADVPLHIVKQRSAPPFMITVEQVYRSLASSHRHRIGVSPRSSVNRLADHLVDGGLGQGAGDGFAGSVALAVTGDLAGVGAEVGVELPRRGEQLARLVTGVECFQVGGDVFEALSTWLPAS
jgi:hypothetical protein